MQIFKKGLKGHNFASKYLSWGLKYTFFVYIGKWKDTGNV